MIITALLLFSLCSDLKYNCNLLSFSTSIKLNFKYPHFETNKGHMLCVSSSVAAVAYIHSCLWINMFMFNVFQHSEPFWRVGVNPDQGNLIYGFALHCCIIYVTCRPVRMMQRWWGKTDPGSRWLTLANAKYLHTLLCLKSKQSCCYFYSISCETEVPKLDVITTVCYETACDVEQPIKPLWMKPHACVTWSHDVFVLTRTGLTIT